MLHQGNHELRLSRRGRLDYPVHLQHALEVIVLLQGSTTVLYDGKRFLMEEGDLFVIFPNRAHGFENSRDATGYVIIVPMNPYLVPYHTTLDGKLPREALLKKGSWEQSRLPEILALAESEWQSLPQKVKQGYILVTVGKLLSLLELEDRREGSGTALDAVLIYLNEHYTEPITRRSLSLAIGYNESYLSHLFALMGTTLTKYLSSLRLRDAEQLLLHTDHSVSRIALSLGFGSIRSFNRAFLSSYSLSPSAYRKKEGK